MFVEAPAKINLNLSISTTLDEDGYHGVETIMCPLELADAVEVEPSADGRLTLVCEPDPLPDAVSDRMRANIAYRAAMAMGEAFGRDPACAIRIEKRIPSQAGLGGGSSDAAAVIRCLARSWGVEEDDRRCLSVASSLGADVAFFLLGCPAHLTGRGDVPVERFDGFKAPVALVKPPVGVSTALAYRAFDSLKSPAVPLEPLAKALRDRDVLAVASNLSNNMEPASLRVAPELADVFEFLQGASGSIGRPLLCGSGSCVALFTVDADAASSIARSAAERGWWSCATSTRA